ncbi:MFS transporter [candidate division WOR-3 bacterium]|nr:MFS transporter [candidate division WOR-3 bacterium]
MIENNKSIRNIYNDRQIIKFGFYGFFKNLKFFEPFLILFFIASGLSLFKVGILFSIREIVTYILEIPSGAYADLYGRKNALLICFISYIISFIIFFFSYNFIFLIIAMMFYGVGEAFRSGTHKAIILSYLNHKNIMDKKTIVYGFTRSFSLIGSSISAVLSVIIVIFAPSLRWIFICSVIPYLLDFILVLTYPSYLNNKIAHSFNMKMIVKEVLETFKIMIKNMKLFSSLFSSSIYDAIFATVKDYIQPILAALITGGLIFSMKDNSEMYLKIMLGAVYAMFYLFSSFASKNAYKITDKQGKKRTINMIFDITGITLIIIALFVKLNIAYIIVLMYLLLYIMKNIRRPIMVDIISTYSSNEKMATILSSESQMKVLFIAVFAPIIGFVADKSGIFTAFIGIGVFMFIINIFIRKGLK